jgi:hypothetical protein
MMTVRVSDFNEEVQMTRFEVLVMLRKVTPNQVFIPP